MVFYYDIWQLLVWEILVILFIIRTILDVVFWLIRVTHWEKKFLTMIHHNRTGFWFMKNFTCNIKNLNPLKLTSPKSWCHNYTSEVVKFSIKDQIKGGLRTNKTWLTFSSSQTNLSFSLLSKPWCNISFLHYVFLCTNNLN